MSSFFHDFILWIMSCNSFIYLPGIWLSPSLVMLPKVDLCFLTALRFHDQKEECLLASSILIFILMAIMPVYMLPPSPVSVEKRLSSLIRVSRKRVHANLGQFSGGSRRSPSLCLDRVTPTNVISITDGQSWSMFRTHSDSGGS